ncbi:MAG: FtsQ-type POTRA domain-containing protein [Actinomycetia bacterium]|nr:FtsQ-type POTRA domain-containing protein [Actinomycetes bacterium]
MTDGPESGRERFRRRRWALRARPYLIGLAVLLVVGGLGWVVAFSSVLGVHDIKVEGTQSLNEKRVLRKAAVPPGEPLATLDTDAVAARVEEMTRVADASVHRRWPRGLTVEVRERETVAVIDDSGTLRGVDETGETYRTYRSAPKGVPTIALDPDVDDPDTVLAEAAAVLGSLDADLAERVSDVEVASIDSIDLLLGNGDRVRWGSADDSERKGVVLEALLETPAQTYDVTAPDHPATSG